MGSADNCAGAQKHQPIVLSTIADLIEGEMHVTAWCQTCKDGHRPIDLEQIAARLGRSYEYTRGFRLRCTKCGSREVGVSISPASNERAAGASHHWG